MAQQINRRGGEHFSCQKCAPFAPAACPVATPAKYGALPDKGGGAQARGTFPDPHTRALALRDKGVKIVSDPGVGRRAGFGNPGQTLIGIIVTYPQCQQMVIGPRARTSFGGHAVITVDDLVFPRGSVPRSPRRRGSPHPPSGNTPGFWVAHV
ncbi:MAG: hypothetical protein CM15mP74_05230 [Halieaceae bacterium]|nr:MAG: hypothetical protein CM15mP74_05230 [Halieaceae bacterium]